MTENERIIREMVARLNPSIEVEIVFSILLEKNPTRVVLKIDNRNLNVNITEQQLCGIETREGEIMDLLRESIRLLENMPVK
jgi:pyrimidine operon attenuation protein/uracil phosphoribosyltransferase